jgi:hypothetical protein
MRRALYACPLVLALAAGAAHGQAPVPDAPPAIPGAAAGAPPLARPPRTLAAGDTVRVVAAAGRYEGTIVRVTPDTVVVGAPGRLDAIPRGEIALLERFRGKSPRGRAILIGAGAGLVGGGVLGGIAGRVAGRVRCRDNGETCTPGEHDSTIQGALLAEGMIIGALVGAMLGPTFRREHWERAEAAFPLAAGPAPGGGIAAGVTLRF